MQLSFIVIIVFLNPRENLKVWSDGMILQNFEENYNNFVVEIFTTFAKKKRIHIKPNALSYLVVDFATN